MIKGSGQEKKKIMLGAVTALIILYADFSYILKIQLHSLRDISGKLHQAKSDLSQYSEDSPYYKSLEADSARLRDKYRDIEKYAFSDAGLSLLLDDISKKAFSLGVKIMQIRPQGIPARKENKDSKGVSSDFRQVGIVLELAGGYHTIGRFLSAIEANPLIEVSEVKINSQPQIAAAQKSLVTLKAYVQKK